MYHGTGRPNAYGGSEKGIGTSAGIVAMLAIIDRDLAIVQGTQLFD